MRRKQIACSGMDWNAMLGLCQRLKKDKLYRDYVLITAGCYFGLRIGDLLKIRFRDIINKDELIINEQKTKKSRRITINSAVHDACVFYSSQLNSISKFNENDFIFSNRWDGPVTVSYINKRLKVIFKKYRVEVDQASSHCLRKTFGRRVYESDGKSEKALIYLSDIFSHSSIAVTRRYIGITQEQISDIYLSL